MIYTPGAGSITGAYISPAGGFDVRGIQTFNAFDGVNSEDFILSDPNGGAAPLGSDPLVPAYGNNLLYAQDNPQADAIFFDFTSSNYNGNTLTFNVLGIPLTTVTGVGLQNLVGEDVFTFTHVSDQSLGTDGVISIFALTGITGAVATPEPATFGLGAVAIALAAFRARRRV